MYSNLSKTMRSGELELFASFPYIVCIILLDDLLHKC
jgi:hypothetical protein